MGCGETLVKYILFITNLIFALGGLVLLGVGIAAQLQVTVITDLVDANFQVAPILTIVIGCIIFIISFFGCCGAIRESNCMLITYSIFMLLLLAINITLASLIFVNLSKFDTEVPRMLEKSFNASGSEGFHVLEKSFQCCGTVGPQSYTNQGMALPPSCCPEDSILRMACSTDKAFKGCNETVVEFLHYFGFMIGLFILIVASVELVVVVFGCCLASHVRNKSRRSRY